MIALAQRWRGEAPATVTAHADATENGVAIANRDNTAGFRRATQQRCRIVDRAAARHRLCGTAGIVQQCQIAGCRRWRGINRNVQGDGVNHIAVNVGNGGAERVAALTQVAQGKAPLPIAVGGGAAEQIAAVKDADEAARPGQAGEGRAVVIGDGAVLQ